MDLSNSKPVDDGRPLRAPQPKPVEAAPSGSVDPTAARSSEAPEAEGPLGSSRSEAGSTRDPAAENQTKDLQSRDQVAKHSLAALIKELTKDLDIPLNTELSIEVDDESQEPRFLVRHKETGEIVREIPMDETRSTLQRLGRPVGNLLDRSY